MPMTVRRYRRRRTGSDALGFTHSPFAPPFFDRLEFLSQSSNLTHKTDAPFIILITEDHYLRTGLLNGPFPLSSCCNHTTLDDAFDALAQWPSARLVVDIESRSTGLIEKLDQLRRHSLYPPFLTPWLLVRADNYDTRLFCKAAGPFHVIERQLNAAVLQQTLLDARLPTGSDKDWFSRTEWPILQALSRGKTLRQIALMQNRPYSRIIYRLSRILLKLGLSNRQELLHLLNNLSDCTF
ncbi:DNA-binding response regulator [Enterobacter cloacae]|uniref:helix-turn-helix transcriptional regulator n=1 Tax=Enterobacter cloacae complex TaxID=354276 RepID=UPI001EDCD886|nr:MULTISPECIES: DNA-binding response regulator [Enterobacter cloacae complex]MCG3100955.1 DNA-binding response regulator [Enterobacter sp. DRP3]MCQ4445962.1 DNA-binding response regulator [Enterobacter cloacae]MDW2869006.1 DNA-binding response regulator [Enterobacter hormaechei]